MLLFSRWRETCWEKHFAPDFCSGLWFWDFAVIKPIGLTIARGCLEPAERISRDEGLNPPVHYELMTGRHLVPLAEWLTSDASFPLGTFWYSPSLLRSFVSSRPVCSRWTKTRLQRTFVLHGERLLEGLRE